MEHDCEDLDDCVKCRSVAAFVEARRLMEKEQKWNIHVQENPDDDKDDAAYDNEIEEYSDFFASDDDNNQHDLDTYNDLLIAYLPYQQELDQSSDYFPCAEKEDMDCGASTDTEWFWVGEPFCIYLTF